MEAVADHLKRCGCKRSTSIGNLIVFCNEIPTSSNDKKTHHDIDNTSLDFLPEALISTTAKNVRQSMNE